MTKRIRGAAIALALFALALLLGQDARAATLKSKSGFSGDWNWSKGKELLTLHLEQSGKELTGWHTAVGQGGLKADEVLRSASPSITGQIDGDTATVTFHSGFPDSKGNGKAKLTLSGNTLSWNILESSGEHYLPTKAKLKRATPKSSPNP